MALGFNALTARERILARTPARQERRQTGAITDLKPRSSFSSIS
jgi:hypothetical protein